MNWLRLKLRNWLGLPFVEANTKVLSTQLEVAKSRIEALEKKNLDLEAKVAEAKIEAKAADKAVLVAAIESTVELVSQNRQASEQAMLDHVKDSLVESFRQLGVM